MRFVLLGTGTLVPDADRGPAGFLIESQAKHILIDGGSGTIQRLKRYGVDARELDAGVYSHRHLDHCGDLAPLLFAMRVGADRPRQHPYPIWAGQGFREFLNQLENVYPGWLRNDRFHATVQELPLNAPGQAQLPGGIRLDTLPARHSAGALHLRFTDPTGFSVVFSGDTGPNENLAILAENADILITECAAEGKDPWDSHLAAEDVAQVVLKARPKRVILTHFYPGTNVEHALRTVQMTGVPVERGIDGQQLNA